VSNFLHRVEWCYFHVLYSLRVLSTPQESAAAVNRHISRIKGAFPRENAKGVIFFACDIQFMERFGYNLIFSCYETARECGVHVHLYEPSADILRRLAALKEQFRDLQLSYTYEDDIDFGSLPERGMYYTAFRFVAARKIMEESKSLLVCLDADSLIMNSLQRVIATARQHDVGLYFPQRLYLRPKQRAITQKITAFCVIFNHTQKSLAFINFFSALALQFHKRYPRTGTNFWFDQSVLYFSYLLSKRRERVSFYAIGKSVVDYEFSDQSCIWTARGKRKHDEVFLKESRRILKKYTAGLDSQKPLENPSKG